MFMRSCAESTENFWIRKLYIGNRTKGAKKNSGPSSWTQEKILPPLFDPLKILAPFP